MILNYKTSYSMVYPDLLDTTSSKTTVYIRKDVEEETKINEFTNEEYKYYKYQEAKLTKTEYQKLIQEQQRADIDYIALMTEIDLEEL